MGHMTSGASFNWAFVFSSYKNPETVHPHNTILSMMFDIGILGLLTVLYLLHRISQTIVTLWKKGLTNEAMTYYALLFYIIFISITESFIGPYYMNAITIFILFACFMIGIHDKVKIEPEHD
ncbi:MAG: hypothetical protein FJY18_00855 [Bacteroidetes bacterium]|nr:hypothetical protein [Bacteroidota bacterium]